MEKLRQLIEALVTEGVLENEVTQVSREIIDQLKLRLSRTAGFVRAFKFNVEPPDAIDVKEIRVTVKRGQAQDVPIVSGGFRGYPHDLSSNVIEVLVEVPGSWRDFDEALGQMSTVVSELKETLRHEFEHTKQPVEDYERISDYDLTDMQDVVNYFLDPAEVAAYVSGLYKHAKTKGIDLADVFTDRQGDVIRLAKQAGADEGGAQDLAQATLDAWREYARKRFPSARL